MEKETLKKWLKLIRRHEPTMSMLLGMVVVFVVAISIFWYIGQFRHRSVLSEVETTPEPTPFMLPQVNILPDKQLFYQEEDQYFVEGLPVLYTVAAGDSTWKIAQAFYGAGENYIDIESENRLQPNQSLLEGMELVIPNVPTRLQVKEITQGSETVVVTIAPTLTPASRPTTYVVKPGEGLWQVAVKFYGNGNAYMRIFEANRDRMKTPDDINPGMTLRLP